MVIFICFNILVGFLKKMNNYLLLSIDYLYNWINLILLLLLLLLSVAFFTLAERKLMGSIQRRKGPDVVGFWGFLQPMADGLKLILKELIFPLRASIFLFIVGPLLVFVLSALGWITIPFGWGAIFNNLSLAVLYNFITASLNVYGLILSGWASNSRYAYLGGVRATAQMISYELVFGMINVIIILITGSFNYSDIIISQMGMWNIFPLFPVFILFLIIMLAETNRTPFDLAEAEAELVAGYNVEYSSIMFALFFLGEYANMLILSVFCVIYFLGGWLIPFYSTSQEIYYSVFYLKVLFFCIFFIWVRATLPRYRYDQLMSFGWKYFLPLIFGLFILYVGIIIGFGIIKPNFNHLAYHQDILFYRLQK
jgi:NADH-quinone oxidoreductase subunit H